ncbi:hypothetical protein RIF29_26454 [Crotalaria pallida]|uniref:K+ potassium transporter integral membrane domain-containing protein n=1 Tax=Crotalaria pallida TaxID=3830 RepID=A0AAN9HY46_CROPI
MLYISASIYKVPEGGWIPLVLSFIFMVLMFTWNYGTIKKHQLVSAMIQFVQVEEESEPEVPTHELSMDTEYINVEGLGISPHTFSHCNADGHHHEPLYKYESLQILKPKESGVTYIVGHSYARAKKSLSILKKFAIDIVYAFQSKNCRDTDVVLNLAHTSFLEVGMVYNV